MGNFQYIANRLLSGRARLFSYRNRTTCRWPLKQQFAALTGNRISTPLSIPSNSGYSDSTSRTPEPLAMDYAFWQKTVFSLTPIHLPLSLRSPRVITAIGAGAVAA